MPDGAVLAAADLGGDLGGTYNSFGCLLPAGVLLRNLWFSVLLRITRVLPWFSCSRVSPTLRAVKARTSEWEVRASARAGDASLSRTGV